MERMLWLIMQERKHSYKTPDICPTRHQETSIDTFWEKSKLNLPKHRQSYKDLDTLSHQTPKSKWVWPGNATITYSNPKLNLPRRPAVIQIHRHTLRPKFYRYRNRYKPGNSPHWTHQQCRQLYKVYDILFQSEYCRNRSWYIFWRES